MSLSVYSVGGLLPEAAQYGQVGMMSAIGDFA